MYLKINKLLKLINGQNLCIVLWVLLVLFTNYDNLIYIIGYIIHVWFENSSCAQRVRYCQFVTICQTSTIINFRQKKKKLLLIYYCLYVTIWIRITLPVLQILSCEHLCPNLRANLIFILIEMKHLDLSWILWYVRYEVKNRGKNFIKLFYL